MKKISVIAATGINVPREDNARRYITDAAAVLVDDTAYYRRQIRAGDLIIRNEAPEPEAAAEPATAIPAQKATAPVADKKQAKAAAEPASDASKKDATEVDNVQS
ncbi:TPA: hypothetical protein MYR53_002215 [Escherichia coli]|nr:hypothetical protein [Escherichia coli]HDW2387513.1 hypothetical protein [Escherichia coli]